jgi:hypothetical protein
MKKRGLPWSGLPGGIWLQTNVSCRLEDEKERTALVRAMQ